ncbi:ATP-grasp domain-containing protein [Mesorhizobium sp. VK9D]|uniref:ATP-grasp domain-containing protein n=1 Tax=Mesorhizobium australafricanum TaxID=3072311 RepID=UPI002A247461|nr:ATP-grasp domain-containing protein [Mesorhizobium sp. VK9D]MDX8455319.1 ATP-grasp domain-containing protein [Mesorhizobium sp. VK9D]
MPLEVSFMFGGISTEYDGSIESMISIASAYLKLSKIDRPFFVRNLYHVSRLDGLVRAISMSNVTRIDDITNFISTTPSISGQTLLAFFDAIASRKEYVVNLLHGQFGEDGGAQTLAALSGLRGMFGDPHVASLTMNKYAMSAFVSSLLPSETVQVPRTILVRPTNVTEAIQVAKSIEGPIVVKPNSLGSSLFSRVFYNSDESAADVEGLLRTIFSYDSAALLQEFIPGEEYTCGCICSSSDSIVFPVVMIESRGQFLGRDQKCSGDRYRKKVVDSTDGISRKIVDATKRIAEYIDIYNIARFDFRVNGPDVWFLECNYLPGLAVDGLIHTMLNHHGMTVIDMIYWIMRNSPSFIKPEHYISYELI